MLQKYLVFRNKHTNQNYLEASGEKDGGAVRTTRMERDAPGANGKRDEKSESFGIATTGGNSSAISANLFAASPARVLV
jgi:hypothetical protein